MSNSCNPWLLYSLSLKTALMRHWTVNNSWECGVLLNSRLVSFFFHKRHPIPNRTLVMSRKRILSQSRAHTHAHTYTSMHANPQPWCIQNQLPAQVLDCVIKFCPQKLRCQNRIGQIISKKSINSCTTQKYMDLWGMYAVEFYLVWTFV